MRGWDAMLGYRTYPEFLHKVVGELEQKAMIQKLLEDAALVRELLTRMSWLAILLATAAFTGAITPPGGWDNGRLFLPYAGNANSLDTCAVLSDSVSGANASKPADTGKDARCPTTIQFGSMRAYNSLILLTFGVSIALVLFLVAFSIPSAKVLQHNRDALAGHIYVQLVSATLVMAVTVACGLGAITAALVTVYPVDMVVSDVWAPFAVSSAFLLIALFALGHAFSNMWPGCAAAKHPFQDLLALLPCSNCCRRSSTETKTVSVSPAGSASEIEPGVDAQPHRRFSTSVLQSVRTCLAGLLECMPTFGGCHVGTMFADMRGVMGKVGRSSERLTA
jgi:hypothetical protein